MPTPARRSCSAARSRLAAERYRTAGLDAAFPFDIAGPAGGRWYLKAAHGRVQVGHGPVERPAMTARMSQAVLAGIASGRPSGENAFRAAVQLEDETTLGSTWGALRALKDRSGWTILASAWKSEPAGGIRGAP